MIPAIRAGESCSVYWARLADEDKSDIRAAHQLSTIPSMTEWLLMRGCAAQHIPSVAPKPPAYRPKPVTLNMYLNGVTRRPAGHVR